MILDLSNCSNIKLYPLSKEYNGCKYFFYGNYFNYENTFEKISNYAVNKHRFIINENYEILITSANQFEIYFKNTLLQAVKDFNLNVDVLEIIKSKFLDLENEIGAAENQLKFFTNEKEEFIKILSDFPLEFM